MTSSVDSDEESSVSNQHNTRTMNTPDIEIEQSTSTGDETETGSSISLSRRNRFGNSRQQPILSPAAAAAASHSARDLWAVRPGDKRALSASKSPVLPDSQLTNAR
jgi:hypothetical protein